jgi:hypothetical protein
LTTPPPALGQPAAPAQPVGFVRRVRRDRRDRDPRSSVTVNSCRRVGNPSAVNGKRGWRRGSGLPDRAQVEQLRLGGNHVRDGGRSEVLFERGGERADSPPSRRPALIPLGRGSRGRYERCVASLYCCSTLVGMRPRAGTATPLSIAQVRITLGSRTCLRERFAPAVRGRDARRLRGVVAETRRPAFQYRSNALDNVARFRLERSSSRHSPFQPSRTVSAAGFPSRSSTSTSTVFVAIAQVSFQAGGRTISEFELVDRAALESAPVVIRNRISFTSRLSDEGR